MSDQFCTEGKLLALHTAVVCLARSLAKSGALDRDTFNAELDQGQQWLRDRADEHSAQAFEALLPMLKGV